MKLNEAIDKVRKIHYYVVNIYNNISLDDDDIEAIDTVLSHINTVNKNGLYDRLQEKSIEVSDNQECLSNKKDRIYTAKDMEDFAEWCAENATIANCIEHRWIHQDIYIIYTDQLRELWEKERREK